MAYQLGVDLGTTYSAAAIGRDGRVEVTTLGTANPVMPSVVLLRADGEVLVGEPAVRRGLSEPTRVAREFKRRLGDPTPLVLGGTPYGAESLMAHLLRGIVDTISEREGARPERVVLTHPANYGPYKVEQMREVARTAGLDLATTEFVTEPQAAAISYATRNRVEPGEVVAVYDFGGGTLDIALVQRNDTGFQIVGRPEGMERFGGIDIDAAIVAFVDQQLDGAIAALDPNDSAVQAAVARLRDDCRNAKEALSGDTDTSISVSLPGLQTNVRLTRAELEDMVRPRIVETVEALDRAVRSAGLTFERISRVLLVGGSSRMPLVGEIIRQRTGRPISVDAHPKFAIALGAAAFGTTHATGSEPRVNPVPPPIVPTPSTPPPPVPGPAAPNPPASRPGPAPAAPPAQTFTPVGTTVTPPDRTKQYIAIGVVAAVVLAVVGFVAFRGDDGGSGSASTRTEDTTDDTDPPDTESPSTAAPDTAAPDTPAPTAAPTIPVTPADIQAAVITSADLPGYGPSTFDPGSDSVCGQFPPKQPIDSEGAAFSKNDGLTTFQGLINEVSYYGSTADAQEVFDTQVSIIQNCPQGEIIEFGGVQFQAIYLLSLMDPSLLSGFSPTCLQGALVLVNFTQVDDPANTFASNIGVLRCANVLTNVTAQSGIDVTQELVITDLTTALAASAQKVSRMQLIP